MIVEKKEIVIVPTDDSANGMGMILLLAIVALAVGVTAWFFSMAGNNNRVVERTTETHDVIPMAVPQSTPAPQPVAPQTITVPQPAAQAPAAPVPADPAPPQPSPSADSQPVQ